MGFLFGQTHMKKPHFFSFSLSHLSRLERLGWGVLLIVVLGFNIFATQVDALAKVINGQPSDTLVMDLVDEVAVAEQEFLPETEARQPRRIYKSTLTAYTSRAEETDSSPFITANGSHVHVGTIASNCLAFGTKVQFPELYGDQVFVVEDRLNSRYGCNMLDVWFPEYNEAIQFGHKYTTVYVL